MRTSARFKKESFFSVPKRELFAFHERDDAFSLLTPASENIEVEHGLEIWPYGIAVG